MGNCRAARSVYGSSLYEVTRGRKRGMRNDGWKTPQRSLTSPTKSLEVFLKLRMLNTYQ